MRTAFIGFGLATPEGVPFPLHVREKALTDLKRALNLASCNVINVCEGWGEYTNDEGLLIREPCLSATVEVRAEDVRTLTRAARDLARVYNQECIALTVVNPALTQFVRP